MVVRTKALNLYETDETAWLEETARLLKEKRYAQLDRKHLAEYLEDMARRDRREVGCRLETLLFHLLKLEFESWLKTGSWEATIRVQRHDLQDLLNSKTLRNYAEEVLEKAYQRAVRSAADEIGLDVGKFPPACPYTLDVLIEE
jgi:hypothetical protein